MNDDVNDPTGEIPPLPSDLRLAIDTSQITAPDPLRPLTDSATAFEDRLAFADDGAGPVIYHAVKAHQKLDRTFAHIQRVMKQAEQKRAEMLHSIFGPGHQCGDIRNGTYTPDGIHCPHGFTVRAGDTFYVNGQECVLGEPEPVKQPCFIKPIFTAPTPDPQRLAARVAHGYEDQEAR